MAFECGSFGPVDAFDNDSYLRRSNRIRKIHKHALEFMWRLNVPIIEFFPIFVMIVLFSSVSKKKPAVITPKIYQNWRYQIIACSHFHILAELGGKKELNFVFISMANMLSLAEPFKSQEMYISL